MVEKMLVQNFKCRSLLYKAPTLLNRMTYDKLAHLLLAMGLWLAFAQAYQGHENLQLLGAVVSNQKSVALIKNSNTNQIKAFKVGEPIWSYGTLIAVDRQTIILQDQDKKPVTISSKLGGLKKGSFAPKVLVSNADKHIEEGFERIGTKTKVDSAYRDRMLKEELPNILMQASSEAVVVNGEIVGFRLFQFEENSIFAKLGMKDGDVVKEINGVALNNVAKTIQFLNGLRSESQVAVSVVRDGQPVLLELNVR